MARWKILSGSRASYFMGAALVVALAVCASFAEDKRLDKNIEVGITKPADEKPIDLRFEGLGVVKSVSIKKGDAIKIGQELMAQDEARELAELDILNKDATDLRVKAMELSARAKWSDFKRIKDIHDKDGGNDAEFEKSEAEAKLADMTILTEKQDLEVKKARATKQQGVIDRMKLHSPIEGIVQTVDAHVGEMVDPSKPPVVTVVNNNPLIVELTLPTAMSLKLKIDQSMRVSYDKKAWKEAKVSYLAPMADAASGMQTINLKLPNPDNQISGLQIFVELPDTLVAAK